MIDYFTKWAVVAPLKTKTGEEVAEAIYLKWYCTFGIPYEIQTDQGNEFTNIILARLNTRLAIGHRITTPYYPQANGQVERFNRTLINSVSIYAESHEGSWFKYLNGLSWAYNTSLHTVTGFSPYYLMFGREPRLPIDIMEGRFQDIKYGVKQYHTSITLNLREAYKSRCSAILF
jgi:transposase InsO family protein